MRQIYPVHGEDLKPVPAVLPGTLPAAVRAVADLYGNGVVRIPADRPWLRANMVASADGAASLNGRSGPLSGSADRMVFTVLRSLADVILVGAGTVRTEHYRPVKGEQIWLGLRPEGAALPAIAIVSASLDLDPTAPLLARAAPGSQTIVITTEAAPADRKAAVRQNARVIESGEKRVDVAAAIRALADLGYRDILTEGGPVLLGHLVRANLVDELCLTTSPVLAGGSTDRIVSFGVHEPTAPAQLKLAHVLADDGYLLSRYLRAL